MDEITDLLPYLLQQSYATRALDVVKMKAFVPCDVDDAGNSYRATIVEVVFDPLRIPEVNGRFRAAGYDVGEGMQVIAVTNDDSILLWGGRNSIFHLRQGETIEGAFDETHLAFDDILDLTNRFKIKNKRVEIQELIAQMTAIYGGTNAPGENEDAA